jgi:hypothetical protein
MEVTGPGQYDVEALKYLNGFVATPPTSPFCTDENTEVDPECQPFDESANPRDNYWGAYFNAYLNAGIAPPAEIVDGLLRFAQLSPTSDAQLAAWELVVARVRPSLPAGSRLPAPIVGGVWDAITKWLFVGSKPKQFDPATRQLVDVDALPLGALRDAIAGDLGGVVTNRDGLRAIGARRQAVDALRRLQTVSGLRALDDARAVIVIEAALPTLSPDERAVERDLVERIERATSSSASSARPRPISTEARTAGARRRRRREVVRRRRRGPRGSAARRAARGSRSPDRST